MGNIDQIVKIVQDHIDPQTHRLSLSLAACSEVPLNDFFANVLLSDHLVIEKCDLNLDAGILCLSGPAKLWSHPEQHCVFRFEAEEQDKVTIHLDITLSGNVFSKIPALTWISTEAPHMQVTYSGKLNTVHTSYRAEVIANQKNKVPVSFSREDNDLWSLGIAEEVNTSISLAELSSLVAGKQLSEFLPADIVNQISNLSLRGIHALIDVGKMHIKTFEITLNVGKECKITEGITLQPDLALVLKINSGDDNLEFNASVIGTFKINQTEIPLYATFIAGDDYHLLATGIQPGKSVTLPSFNELFHFADPGKPFSDLPGKFSEIPSIRIDGFSASFDFDRKKFTELYFNVRTTDEWKIVPDFFSIKQISAELEMDLGPDDTRLLQAEVLGKFTIGDVSVFCLLNKTFESDDWTISGGLLPGTTLSLTKIATQLFKGKDYIPAKTPDFSFSELEITVVPASKKLNFKAASDQPWIFNEHISITKFGLEFDRDPEKPNNHITGHVNGSITIGTSNPVTISLSAAFGETAVGGWQLEGSTDKGLIPIGKLAESIAHAFDAKAEVPDWFSGITLSEIGAGYNTKSGNFHFEVTGKIPVANNPLTITVKFTLENDGTNKFKRHLSGKLLVGDNTEFDLDIENSASGTHINGEWKAKNAAGYLRLTDLATKLGFKEVPKLPEALQLNLKGARFLYDSVKSLIIVTVQSENDGTAVFVSAKFKNEIRFYAFCLSLKLNVRLADIPLVGDKIPGAENLGINEANAWILSDTLSADDVTTLNAAISNPAVPQLPAGPLNARVVLHALLQLGASQTKSLDITLGEEKKRTSLADTPAENDSSSPTWIDIQKQFGVFHFNRIGFAYNSPDLQFLLDAGMDMGPLSFTLDGLSVSSPLTEFKPTFDLSGLGISYQQGQLDIEGALHKLPKEQLDPDIKFQFDGLAVIKAGKFSLGAVGSYALMESGDASLFLFAQVEAAIGGPPAFFITGIMAGFGFNRSLLFPEMNEVASFPLLLLGEPAHPGDKAARQDSMHVLDILSGKEPAEPNGKKKKWIKTESGQYWLALGLHFTSFQIVRSRALLAAQFGNDLSFALLGISTLQLPQSADTKHPYVFAELQLRALLQPREGFFGLSAILSSSSYVLTPECHLTGGFAMYFWFGSNKYSGQFVISMGGYHPAFSKPDHYPALPRLGFNWVVSSTISIKGGAYFALTPSCVMAGGALEAIYRDGSIKAWFTAHADFLIAWRPFFFLASIGVSIGVDLNAGSDDTQSGMSFSVSADLDLWGPPTGGKARVHIIFITFTIHFGSDDALANNNALKWHEFSDLLPHKSEVCRIIATGGMVGEKMYGDVKKWIVRSGSFTFTTESALPSGDVVYGSDKKSARTNETNPKLIDIRPMNKTGVSSVHHVQIFFNGKSVSSADMKDWKFNLHANGMPDALWGKPPAKFSQVPSAPKASMTEALLSGFNVTPPAPQLGSSPGTISAKALAQDYLSPEGCSSISANAPVSDTYTPVADANSISVVKTIASPEAQKGRDEMKAMLTTLGVNMISGDSMKRLAEECTHLYDNPVLLKK